MKMKRGKHDWIELNGVAISILERLQEQSGRKPTMLIKSPYGQRYLEGQVSHATINAWLNPQQYAKTRKVKKVDWRKVILAYNAAAQDPRISITPSLLTEFNGLRERSGYSPYALAREVVAYDYLDEDVADSDIRIVFDPKSRMVARRKLNSYRMAFCAAALHGEKSLLKQSNDKEFFRDYKFTLSPVEVFEYVDGFFQETREGGYQDISGHEKIPELCLAAKAFEVERNMALEDIGLEFIAQEVSDVPFSTIEAMVIPKFK